MKNRDYFHKVETLINNIKKGAFLTVQAMDQVNTMTIGWASLGFIWQRPIFMVAVRDSRHTFTLLEQTNNFTVSIPMDSEHKKAISFCGTKSGRDYDKFKECNLTLRPALVVQSPVIEIAAVHYECKIVHKGAMDNSLMDPDLEKLYPQKDYHTLYFGEIVACYEWE